MTTLAELEALAKAATPGPWLVREPAVYLGRQGGFDLRDCPLPKENSRYIAAANPQTILRLIELVRKMESALVNVEPFVDSLICYASTRDEYEGNHAALSVSEALAKLKEFEE